MEFIAAAYTDKGPAKSTNQDSLCLRRVHISNSGEAVMAVVCDGMGGLTKGEMASAAVVTAFGHWFEQVMNDLPRLCADDFSGVRNQWSGMLEKLHCELRQHSRQQQIELGTTVAAFLACGDRYLTAVIGDSRIYECRETLNQLTEDQSLVAREIAHGRITQEEGRHHPQRNVLLQCLGAGDSAVPVYRTGQLKSGGCYLICSDGLVHEILPSELKAHLSSPFLTSRENMTEALRELTSICRERGERDDITALLIRVCEGSAGVQKSETGGWFRRLFRASEKQPENRPAETVELVERAEIVHSKERIG